MYVANRLDFKYVATSYLIACAAVHQWNIYIPGVDFFESDRED